MRTMDEVLLKRLEHAVGVMDDMQSALSELESAVRELKRTLCLLPADVFKKELIYRPSEVDMEPEDGATGIITKYGKKYRWTKVAAGYLLKEVKE